MSTTASRNLQVQFSGDLTLNVIQSALDNIVSPGQVDIVELSQGANVIIPPSVVGIVTTGLTIIPPAGNVSLMTLKGVTGDTGIPLHKTDPTVIALDVSFAGCFILAATTIEGVRLIWS